MRGWLGALIESALPDTAWRVTERKVFTTYYQDCEKVGRLTGRIMILNKDFDWVVK